MENLTILNKQTTISGQEIILKNTVDYNWNVSTSEVLPTAVNFIVKRGVLGDENFNGNLAITGNFYPSSNKFDFINNSYIAGDEKLYVAILETCQQICENDKGVSDKITKKN